MREKSNLEVLHETFTRYCLDIPFVRYLITPIMVSTLIACYLEVEASNISKNLTEDLENGRNAGYNCLKYIFFLLASLFLNTMNAIVFSGPIQYVYRVVGVESFYYYISLGLEPFNQIGSGEIQQIIERKSRAYGDILEQTFMNLLPVIFTLCIAFYSVYNNLGTAAFYVMIVTSVIYVFFTILFSIWRTTIRKSYNSSQDISSNKLQDFLGNYETITAYNDHDRSIKVYDETQKSVETHGTRSHRYLFTLFFIQKFIFALQGILIILVGYYGYLSEKISPKDLIYYLSISRTLSSSLNSMGLLYTRYVQGLVNAKSGYTKTIENEQDTLIRNIQPIEKIEFRNVSFTYNLKIILDNASFIARKSEKIAIIGKNGTGKSTVIKLLMKFYQHEGEILLNGIKSTEITDLRYRKIFSYATQNSFLFNGSIKYNILYGNKNVSDEQILTLAKKLNIHDSIMKLPDGYDTHVGERGKLLSGGERQKILLMRSLLRRCEIVLLDEPTSALDVVSESEITKTIFDMSSHRTIFMILHNLDLLYLFDKILLIKDHKVSTIDNVKQKFKEDRNYFINILKSN